MDTRIGTEYGFVSQKHMRIAEIIHDYDPYLQLTFIPENDRSNDPNEKPFAIVDLNSPNGKPYFVLFATEAELDSGSILAKLFMMDNRKNSLVDRIKTQETVEELLKLKEEIEVREYVEDMARTLGRLKKYS